jgi:hypothetical protein
MAPEPASDFAERGDNVLSGEPGGISLRTPGDRETAGGQVSGWALEGAFSVDALLAAIGREVWRGHTGRVANGITLVGSVGEWSRCGQAPRPRLSLGASRRSIV